MARAEAFSRRTLANVPTLPVDLEPGALQLIDRLVRRDRTAVSSALLAVAGIGAAEPMRQAACARERNGLLGASGGRDQRAAQRADRSARQARPAHQA